MEHHTQMVRTNMGRYKMICSCGWESPIVSKGKAIQARAKHLKDKDKGGK